MFIEPKPVYKSSIHAIISQQRQTRSCMTSPLILDGDVKSKSVLFSSSDNSCGCDGRPPLPSVACRVLPKTFGKRQPVMEHNRRHHSVCRPGPHRREGCGWGVHRPALHPRGGAWKRWAHCCLWHSTAPLSAPPPPQSEI